MQYQISAPLAATAEKQADELGRLLRHGKTITLQFVTVAGVYKPTRARLTLLTVPDRVAEGAARALAVLSGREEGVTPSAAVRVRPEWSSTALLLPTTSDAPALDGALLDGWDSACLTVVYRPGRVLAQLVYCAEDSARVAGLTLAGWRVIRRPNPLQRLLAAPGRPWRGVPSLAPVPGDVMPSAPASARVLEPHPQALDTPPTPPTEEVAAVLTTTDDGVLLGVGPDGAAVRLARRAMTLALVAPPEARQRAVLALIRHAMQAGLGVVTLVERTLLPREALAAWEARLRRLDVQTIAESSAIPWREIAPDLLAQAIGGPAASLLALPSRFGAVLDTLGAEALRVPSVLGLASMPGDDLRGVLAAGGLLLVPQDGDAASTLVARLLLAYLATPPTIGRGVLVLAEKALVPPDGLRRQAMVVVLGERSDALLELRATEGNWTLCAPSGARVVELLPDLLAQPSEGAGELVDSIVRDIGVVADGVPALAARDTAPLDSGDGWWASSARADDLEIDDAEPIGGVVMPPIPNVTASEVAADHTVNNALIPELPAGAAPISGVAMPPIPDVTASEVADEVLALGPPTSAPDDEVPAGAAPISGITTRLIEDVTTSEVADDLTLEDEAAELDNVLGCLLHVLMTDVLTDPRDKTIQAAVAGEQFAEADAGALAWAADAPQLARPWLWRVVLAEEDIDRAVAAWRAIEIEPDGAHSSLARAVLDAMDATEPAAWLVGIGEDALGDLFESELLLDEAEQTEEPTADRDDEIEALLQLTPAAIDLAAWPITLDDDAAPIELGRGERETSPAPASWAAVARTPLAAPALSAAGHVDTMPANAGEELRAAIAPAPQCVPATALADDLRVRPAVGQPPPAAHAHELSDDAIRAAWQAGESVPQLVARLVAGGVDAATARARVRAIVAARPAAIAADLAVRPASGMSGITVPSMCVPAPLVPTPTAASAALPVVTFTAHNADAVAPTAHASEPPVVLMAGNTMPNMGGEIDDTAIWRRWLANEKTDDLVVALCARRGGPKADAARDRIYAVVVPQIVAALDCGDLVDRLAGGEAVADDPRYAELMKQLARSEHVPAGNLERSYLKRLISVRPGV